MGGTAALSDEGDFPAGPSKPFEPADRGKWRKRGGAGGDPPAGERRGRHFQRIHVPFPPSPPKQGGGAAFLGRQLEPTSCRHQGAAHLADHRRQRAMANAFLHDRQSLFVIAAIGIENMIGRKARLSERRSEEIAPGERPKHLAAIPISAREAGGQGGNEERGGAIVVGRRAGRRRLVKPNSQAAAGETAIDVVDFERNRPAPGVTARALDRFDLRAQGGNRRMGT
jgi:hypothetical protein